MKKERVAAFLMAFIIMIPVLLTSCRGKDGNEKGKDSISASVSGSENSGNSGIETDKLPNRIPDKTYGGTSIRMITAAESGNGVDKSAVVVGWKLVNLSVDRRLDSCCLDSRSFDQSGALYVLCERYCHI